MSEHTAESDASIWPPLSRVQCGECGAQTAILAHGTTLPEWCGLCGVWLGPDQTTRVIPPGEDPS